jgi:hypothetical protein
VMVLLLRRMDRDLRGRKGEDELAAARIRRGETEHVSEEGTVGIGIAAVDHHVGARDTGFIQSVYRACARSRDAAPKGRGAGQDHQDAEAEHDAHVELQR